MMAELTVLCPKKKNLEQFYQASPSAPFCELTLDFLDALSKALLSNEESKAHPELVALGFWLRRSNIALMQRQITGMLKPLGTVVHFTPSNVDTMFVYSWVCSLLMGNKNIVRVATAVSEQRTLIEQILNTLFSDTRFTALAMANRFVSYDKSSDWTAELSKIADGRVIWGGDASVQAIRGVATKPRCRDISFADRYSVSVIHANSITGMSDVEKVAESLWRDSQPYAQQACSSPKLLFWCGSDEWQTAFFDALNTFARPSQQIQQTNQHLVTTQLLQQEYQVTIRYLEAVCVLGVEALNEAFYTLHSGRGLFYLKQLDAIEELPLFIDQKCQTLSYWGVEKADLLKLLSSPSITGIDRAVPMGQALNFHHQWDGYNLFSQLSRSITVE